MRDSLKNRSAIVYMVINIANGKRYIGITCKPLYERKSQHFYQAKIGRTNMLLCKAIRKYGRESFLFTILVRCESYEDALICEVTKIAELKPEYNLSAGGEGSLGYKHTDESKKKMSESSKGQQGYWKGKKLPPHVVALRTEVNNRPEVAKKWEKNVLLGSKAIMRPVVCLDDGKIYECIRYAAQYYGADEACVGAICLGKKGYKTARGKKFEFYIEPDGRVAI